MEAAYGLSIVLCMIMTTILLNFYMQMKRYHPVFITITVLVYLSIESLFLVANLSKFMHGGWFTLIIAGVLITVMSIMFLSKKLRERYTETVRIDKFKHVIQELSVDTSIPKYATHLVYMTSASHPGEIETKIIHSILQRKPKRADIYWFIHLHVTDDPYRMEYKVTHIAADDIIRVDFLLGFRIAPRINMLYRKVLEDLVANKEVDITSRYDSLNKNNVAGDFQFIVIQKYLSGENDLPLFERIIMEAYFMLKRVSLSEERAFGLETSSVLVEKFPFIIRPRKEIKITRVE
jgi:KUP system potassium uptake protein